MKLQLIMLTNPVLVSDEDVREGEKYWHTITKKVETAIHCHGKETHPYPKIIAGTPELPSIDFSALSEEDCNRIGWVDVEKLALQEYTPQKNKDGEDMTKLVGHSNPYGFNKFLKAFKKGFKASQPLNEKRFSLSANQIAEIIRNYVDVKPIADFGFDSSDLAEHLVAAIKAEESRPKIFDVEVEMEENNSIKITKIL